MIYVDISAGVHSRAGLGRYTVDLARALIAAQPERFGLFYNQGQDGRFPPTLPSSTPQRSVKWGYKPWRMPFNRLAPNAELFYSTERLLMIKVTILA